MNTEGTTRKEQRCEKTTSHREGCFVIGPGHLRIGQLIIHTIFYTIYRLLDIQHGEHLLILSPCYSGYNNKMKREDDYDLKIVNYRDRNGRVFLSQYATLYEID